MTRPTTNLRKPAVLLSLSVLALLALSPTSAAADDADIMVTFTADDMGFTATSTKDISNIIVELCDGTIHKHDGLTGMSYVHTETQAIAGVWVKSGNNGIGGDAPPGAGERFDNEGVECSPPTSTTTTTTSTTTSTTEPPTSTTTSTTEPPTNTTTTTSTTEPPVDTTTSTTEPPTSTTSESPAPEIPVFPSWTSLAIGLVGALAGTLFVLRRKLP